MPLIDLPLNELYSYTGRNPRPADFDDYWSAALNELRGLDPKVTLAEVPTPAAFARAFDMRWTGVGGAEVYAKLMRPKSGSTGPALVKFHGYSMHSCDWSQGGGLTLACAALEPRVARIAPVYPFLCDYQRVWEMDLAANNAYDELRSWFRRFDPRHEREAEVFTRLGYIDNQHLAPRINAQTLMVSGMMDLHCPISTQFAAYNRIAAPKDVLIYPDYSHEGLPDANDRIFAFMCEML